MKAIISTTEAARAVGVSRVTILTWIKECPALAVRVYGRQADGRAKPRKIHAELLWAAMNGDLPGFEYRPPRRPWRGMTAALDNEPVRAAA